MMKKQNLFYLFTLALASLVMLSCNKDDEPDPIDLTPKLDGLYVFGTNTIAESSLEPAAKMARALMNPDKTGDEENVEGIYGKLMYVGAGGSLEFVEVTDSLAVSYGTETGGYVESGLDVDFTDIDADIIHDTLIVDGMAVEIDEEGLYYVYVDMNTLEIRIMKVEAQIIGDATELQWTAGTPLPQVHASVDSAVFEATDLPLVGASGYRLRFGNGWELYNDGSKATYTHLGVEDYGTAWDTRQYDVGYFKDNIPNHDDGLFTLRLKFDPSTGEWKETKIRTASLPKDYSATQLGLFGNAYVTAPNDTADWVEVEDALGLKTPAVDGNVYTWSWEAVELIQDREFIFLENGAWGNLLLDYTGFDSVEGAAASAGDIVDATTVGGEYHNFYVVTEGAYDIELVIDVGADSKTVTFTSVAGK